MKKNYYNAPTVKVVAFKVEVGIQTSVTSVGSGSEPEELGMEELKVTNWYES